MHRLVARDHDARADVSDYTGYEDRQINHGHWYYDVQRVSERQNGVCGVGESGEVLEIGL